MSLQELQEKANRLSVTDRLALLTAIIRSLQNTPEIESWLVRAARSIAELKPISQNNQNKQLRPFGLCAGEFAVPDDFDAPLSEDLLSAFEGR